MGNGCVPLNAVEQRGPSNEEENHDEPSDKGHSPEEAFLFFYKTERTSGEKESRGRTGDTLDNGSNADVRPGLPCNGVALVRAEIVEDAGRRSWDGLVEVASGDGGRSLIVIKDGERFQATFKIDGVMRDDLIGLHAGSNLGSIGIGHLRLGLVGSAAKHLLESGRCGTSAEREDKAEDQSVKEDGTVEDLLANHQKMLLDGGLEEIGEDAKPEDGRPVAIVGVSVAQRPEHWVLIFAAEPGGVEVESSSVERQ